MSLDYPNREDWMRIRSAQRNEVPVVVFYDPYTPETWKKSYKDNRNAAKRLLGKGRQRVRTRKLIAAYRKAAGE